MELFDIVADPYESNDLKEEQPDLIRRLLSKLTAWKTKLPEKPTGNVFSDERSP